MCIAIGTAPVQYAPAKRLLACDQRGIVAIGRAVQVQAGVNVPNIGNAARG